MVSTAWREAHDSYIIAVLMDAAHAKRTKSEELLLAELAKRKVPQKTVLILNKIDLLRRDKLLQMAQEFSDSGLFQDIYMVSALTGDGCDRLLDDFAKALPEGPWLYDPEIVSDMPARLLAAEITRENFLNRCIRKSRICARWKPKAGKKTKPGDCVSGRSSMWRVRSINP